jgi:serine/threonine protein kinase
VITYDGAVKLLDFGIARWTGVTQHTHVGVVKGKAPYTSPEQLLKRSLDGRSDLFSLGAMLYEMTTMRAPFGSALGEDEVIMQRIVEGGYPPPDEIVPGYPPALAAIVARCLEPTPERRYRSGDVLRADLLALDAAASDQALARWLRELFGQRNPPWFEEASTVRQPVADEPAPEPPVTAPVRTGHSALAIALGFAVTLAAGLGAIALL